MGSSRTRRRRIALILWFVWALLAWNVVFDQVMVFAGRRYLRAAAAAVQAGGPYARIEDWMRPAVTHGLWIATVTAAAILAVGIIGVRLADARSRACV